MMKKNPKLAIFDIDGTLIKRGDTHITDSAITAINRMRDNGIDVMIATGRAFYFIQDDIHERINPDYYVTINGALVYNQNKEVVHEVPMLFHEVDTLTKFAREHNLGIGYKLRDDMHIYSNFQIFLDVYLQGSPKAYILKDYSSEVLAGQDDEMPKGIFLMGDEATIETKREFLEDSYLSKAYHDAYDVYSKRAGKMKGIEVVLEKLELSWDDVIAFGDADNDVDMIEAARIGVAMGDAPEHLKEVADFVTKKLVDDGIAHAIETLIDFN